MMTIAPEGNRKERNRSLRTCVSCRRTAAPDQLIRVTGTDESGLVVDWKRNLGGRGGHVCVTRECVERALRGRLFDRALKCRVKYPTQSEFMGWVVTAMERKLAALVSASAGSRNQTVGTDACTKAMEGGSVRLLLVAGDMADRKKWNQLAEKADVRVRVYASKNTLGELLGRRATGVVAITDRRLADAITACIDEMNSLMGANAN